MALQRNKSLEGVIPTNDKRVFRPDVISPLIQNYTFTPRMNPVSEELAIKHYRKLEQIRKSKDLEQELNTLQENQGQSTEEGREEDVEARRLSKNRKMELVKFKQRLNDQRLD